MSTGGHSAYLAACYPVGVAPDWLTLGAVVAVGGLLWRALSTRIDDVGRRLDTLASDVKSLDRRVARLEGWLERNRLGTATGSEATP